MRSAVRVVAIIVEWKDACHNKHLPSWRPRLRGAIRAYYRDGPKLALYIMSRIGPFFFGPITQKKVSPIIDAETRRRGDAEKNDQGVSLFTLKILFTLRPLRLRVKLSFGL